jgi:hypothetical protein
MQLKFLKNNSFVLTPYIFIFFLYELDWYVQKKYFWAKIKDNYVKYYTQLSCTKEKKLRSGFYYFAALFVAHTLCACILDLAPSWTFGTSYSIAHLVDLTYEHLFDYCVFLRLTPMNLYHFLISFVCTLCTIRSGSIIEFMYFVVKNWFLVEIEFSLKKMFYEPDTLVALVIDFTFIIAGFAQTIYKHRSIDEIEEHNESFVNKCYKLKLAIDEYIESLSQGVDWLIKRVLEPVFGFICVTAIVLFLCAIDKIFNVWYGTIFLGYCFVCVLYGIYKDF